jgi:hypothetical protein
VRSRLDSRAVVYTEDVGSELRDQAFPVPRCWRPTLEPLTKHSSVDGLLTVILDGRPGCLVVGSRVKRGGRRARVAWQLRLGNCFDVPDERPAAVVLDCRSSVISSKHHRTKSQTLRFDLIQRRSAV